MKAQYAHLVASIATRVGAEAATALTYDLKFLYLAVYPMISQTMWRGGTDIIVSASRLTDPLRHKLRDDGYHVAQNTKNVMTQIISWGAHKIPSIDGEAERLVPSWEYEKWLSVMDERFERERETYDLHS